MFLLTLLFSVLIVISMSLADAKEWYVHKDSPCPGTGTSASPFCKIQMGVDAAQPGDVIKVRESGSSYPELVNLTKSGSPGNPNVLEADAGHRPVLTAQAPRLEKGAITNINQSYWTIRGLTFDGKGAETPKFAIYGITKKQEIQEFNIEQNTIQNWGGTRENTRGAAGVKFSSIRNSKIVNNTFSQNAHSNITLIKTNGMLIQGNDISSGRCGRKGDGRVGGDGIKIASNSVNTTVTENDIYEFNDAECPFSDFDQVTAIYCDTGGNAGHIFKNKVWNFGNKLHASSSRGIKLESRCSRWVVEDNLIQNVGHDGLVNDSRVGDSGGNQWLHNTVIGGQVGFNMKYGKEVVFTNNLLINNAVVAVIVQPTAANDNPHIDHNHYWKLRPDRLGVWMGELLDFEAWQETCNCDHNSIFADPSR
jgi:hypothetical protein